MRFFYGRNQRSERGETMASLIVALALTTILIMLVLLIFQMVARKGREVVTTLQVVHSLEAVEDYFREEFSRLEFSPFCPALIPRDRDVLLGRSFSGKDRDQLRRSVTIYRQQKTKRPYVDLQGLRGQGAGQYHPVPVKGVSRVVEGSDMFLVSGLLPVPMILHEGRIEGELIDDLVGIRRAKFYLTDCRQSLLIEGVREGDLFVVDALDIGLLEVFANSDYVQVYMIKEYFGYLQIDKNMSSFVLDMLDGQAFVRIPSVIDMQVSLSGEGVFSLDIVAGVASSMGVRRTWVLQGEFDRQYQNAEIIVQKEIEIRLE